MLKKWLHSVFLMLLLGVVANVFADAKAVQKSTSSIFNTANTHCEIKMMVDGICFTGETQIQLADHNTKSYSVVSNVFSRVATQLTKIVVGGTLLMATPDHEVYANSAYHSMSSLQVGDTMYDDRGQFHLVETSETFDTFLVVYNLETKTNHNYFAGHLSLLVHNNCASIQESIYKCSFAELTTLFKGVNDDILKKYYKTISDSDFDGLNKADFHKKLVDLGDNIKRNNFLKDFADDPIALKQLINKSELVESWAKLSDLTGARAWARTSVPLLEKMSGKTDDLLDKVRLYYSSHQMPSICSTRPKCVFQGDGFTVHFDDFGHPRFEGFVPEMNGVGKVTYNPDAIGAGNLPSSNKTTLGGSNGTDIADANRWIKQAHSGKVRTGFRPDGTKIPDGRIEILDKDNNWIECTWHHHEDGRNLIPVPSNVHNRSSGGAGHTGGESVINNGMKDFFNSLQF